MRAWSNTYRGALGTFLYDTYGWEIFSLNFSEDFANMFKGLRIDSGDNREQLDKICRKYRSLSIDPATKQVVFSNALDVDRAIELNAYARGRCQPSFGIGTHFTNCKLSEDRGKHSGDADTVERFKALIHFPK